MGTMMQFTMKGKTQKQKLIKIAAVSALPYAGYIFSRISSKITSDKSDKELESSESRTNNISKKITSDESNKELQCSENRTNKVPTKIISDESNKELQCSKSRTSKVPTKALKSSQSRTNIDPTKMANDQWIRSRELQNLQCRKKLCLVLDLDHTLIHSKTVSDLSPGEVKNCLDKVSAKDDIYRWKFLGYDRLIKLRPFVRKFLEEANKLFEMYIFTMGIRSYALHVASILDPESIYFRSRIISREDCTVNNQKGLDLVPVDESGVLILDDTVKVWSRSLGNLIVMKKYRYFAAKGATTGSSLEKGTDESESAGSLNCALKLLQEVHNLYFGRHDMLDVRVLLGNLRQPRQWELYRI